MEQEEMVAGVKGAAQETGPHSETGRNLKRNFTAALFDGGLLFSGLTFISAFNLLPLYMSNLTTSRIIIGLPMAIMEFGWYVPQLFSARYGERLSRQKPFVLSLMLLGRTSLLVMVVLTFVLGDSSHNALLVIFLVAYTVFALSWGAWIPPYYTMIGRIIPATLRGSLAGWSFFLSSAFGVAGTFLVRYLLDGFSVPYNFALTFSVGIGLFFLALISLSFIREPVHNPPRRHESLVTYIRRIPKLFAVNRNYAKFVGGIWLALFSYMGFYFFSVYAIRRFDSPQGEVGTLMLIFLVAQAVTTPLFGKLADRIGHKVNIESMLWAYAVSLVLVMFAQSNLWFYAAYVFVGISNASYLVSNSFILLEFGPPEETQAYISLANTVLAPAAFLSPIVGGAVADWLGYPALFGISLFFCLASMVVLRFLVVEPRGLHFRTLPGAVPAPEERFHTDS